MQQGNGVVKTRVEVSRGWFGLWVTLRHQMEMQPGQWVTMDTYRTRSLKTKPKDAYGWVWGFFIHIGTVTTPKLEVA